MVRASMAVLVRPHAQSFHSRLTHCQCVAISMIAHPVQASRFLNCARFRSLSGRGTVRFRDAPRDGPVPAAIRRQACASASDFRTASQHHQSVYCTYTAL